MLPQLWFFAILSPLALGVPVHRESVNPSLTPRYSPLNTKILNSRVNTGADSSRQWSRTSEQGSKIRVPNSLSTGVPGLSSGILSGDGFIEELEDGGFFNGGSGQDRGNVNIAKSGGTVHSYSSGNGADGASHTGGEGTRKASIHESTVGGTNTGNGTTTSHDGTPGSNGRNNVHVSVNGADGASHRGGEGTRKASFHERSVGNQTTGSGTRTGSDGTPGSDNTVAINQRSGTTDSSSVVRGAQAEE